MKQISKYLVIVLAVVAFFFSSCAGSRNVTKTKVNGIKSKTVTKKNVPVSGTACYPDYSGYRHHNSNWSQPVYNGQCRRVYSNSNGTYITDHPVKQMGHDNDYPKRHW